MGDLFSIFTGNNITNIKSNNSSVYNSKTDFNNKTSISDFRNHGANKIKFNGQELKAKDIRDVVGNIISGGHQTAKQIMRQLKDKYRVEIDDRRKIMRAVTSKYAGGSNDNRTDTTKVFLKVNKALKTEGISAQTSKEIRDKIKQEIKASGKSETAENIEQRLKRMKAGIRYSMYEDRQKDSQNKIIPFPGAAERMKLGRKNKEEALKGSLESNGVKTNLENIGAKRQAGIVSIQQYQQNKHYEKATSALSGEKTATPVAGKVIPVNFRKGGDTASAVLKKAA